MHNRLIASCAREPRRWPTPCGAAGGSGTPPRRDRAGGPDEPRTGGDPAPGVARQPARPAGHAAADVVAARVRWAFAAGNTGGLHVGTAIAASGTPRMSAGSRTNGTRAHASSSRSSGVQSPLRSCSSSSHRCSRLPGEVARPVRGHPPLRRLTVLVLSVASRLLSCRTSAAARPRVGARRRADGLAPGRRGCRRCLAVAPAADPDRSTARGAGRRYAAGRDPPIGTTRATGREAVIGWHQFASALPSGGIGSRMVVSRGRLDVGVHRRPV
jgi:hypothetical protein